MGKNLAFVIMQNEKDSPDRKRADEGYIYIVAPTLRGDDLEPYRADLDPTSGRSHRRFSASYSMRGSSLRISPDTTPTPTTNLESSTRSPDQ